MKILIPFGVGDTTTVDGKAVRILGFNHDELANSNAYGGKNKFAGISFEYLTNIYSHDLPINTDNDNSGGWGACSLRSNINDSYLNSLSAEVKNNIKEVKKEYISVYNDENSKEISIDKLWLLSCAEIWNNGAKGTDPGETRGFAVATEGKQYKYYAKINPFYSNSNEKLVKSELWWLRSPCWSSGEENCLVDYDGMCSFETTSTGYGIMPGFSI